MNPDQPSREQIEARLTALLLGELPAAEAELLRWSIARDPDLQKLHDQLKLTIGFVREAMHNPAGASVEKETPRKLSPERRHALLAHFKTARPRKLFWLKRIEMPSPYSLAIAAVAILIFCGVVAISIPNFVKARATSPANACINNLRQIEAAKDEWARETGKPNGAVVTEDDITPYIQLDSNGNIPKCPAGGTYLIGKVGEPAMAELDGKLLTASSGSSQFGLASLSSVHTLGIENYRLQSSAAANGWNLETGQSTTSAGTEVAATPNPGKSSITPTLAPIALPNTESSQTESQQDNGGVYQNNTVGYINLRPGPFADRLLSVQPPAPTPSQAETWAAATAGMPSSPSASMPSQPEVETAPTLADAAPPVPPDSISPPSEAPAPMYNGVEQAQVALPFNVDAASMPASKNEKSSATQALMPPRLRQEYAEKNGIVNGAQPWYQQQQPRAVMTVTASTPIPAGDGGESMPEGRFPGSISGAVPNNANNNSIPGTPAGGNYTFNRHGALPSVSSDLVRPTLGGGGGGTSSFSQSPFITREMKNAKDVNESSVGLPETTTPIPAPPMAAQGENAPAAPASPAETPTPATQAGEPMIPAPASTSTPLPEILTSDNAFSTFAMNVSDVSFKLAMASLGNGQMPLPDSIRSEEFINAFDYHDPEPLQGQPLSFTSERARDPFAQERDILRFSIKAAAAGRQEGRALNLVLLLDTSGSMERADRVAIIREALRVLAAQLEPQDTVSVVTFARTARLWADGVPGDQAGATLDKVGGITPEGGTNLEEAMRLAYETALRHFLAGGINRVVLLTDGAANLGNVDPQALTQKVEAERRQGIALDCFGIGWEDYNDDLLEQLSSNGDGRYAFINSPDEASTEFAAKLAGALQVAAEDVKVQVEFNPDRVTAWRQIGYAKHQLTKQQFRDNTVAAGVIASREAGNALYVIETRPDGEGPIATVRVRYRVPGTQDVRERSWLVDYTGAAPELAQASPAMRLAVTAAEFSEWLAGSPYAQDVTLDDLLNDLSGVPQFYGADERPKQLEWMIRQAKSIK